MPRHERAARVLAITTPSKYPPSIGGIGGGHASAFDASSVGAATCR